LIGSGIPVTLTDANNNILLQYFPTAFSEEELEELTISTDILFLQNGSKTDCYRDIEQVYLLGCWRDSAKKPFLSQQTSTPQALQWISKNQRIFQTAMPKLHSLYESIPIPKRHFGAWAAVAVNKLHSHGTALHVDRKDYQHGFCWVLAFGSFSNGGAMYLQQSNTKIYLKSGDMMCFKSTEPHQVEPFSGNRYSVVFFSHQNLFYNNGQPTWK
jgi:hypothetical protein